MTSDSPCGWLSCCRVGGDCIEACGWVNKSCCNSVDTPGPPEGVETEGTTRAAGSTPLATAAGAKGCERDGFPTAAAASCARCSSKSIRRAAASMRGDTLSSQRTILSTSMVPASPEAPSFSPSEITSPVSETANGGGHSAMSGWEHLSGESSTMIVVSALNDSGYLSKIFCKSLIVPYGRSAVGNGLQSGLYI